MNAVERAFRSWCGRCGRPCDYTRESWRRFVQEAQVPVPGSRWIEGRVKGKSAEPTNGDGGRGKSASVAMRRAGVAGSNDLLSPPPGQRAAP